MEFRNVVIGDQVYGEDFYLDEVAPDFDFSALSRRYESHLDDEPYRQHSFDSRRITYELEQNKQSKDTLEIELMFFMITTCHECLKDGDGYQGPSPD